MEHGSLLRDLVHYLRKIGTEQERRSEVKTQTDKHVFVRIRVFTSSPPPPRDIYFSQVWNNIPLEIKTARNFSQACKSHFFINSRHGKPVCMLEEIV